MATAAVIVAVAVHNQDGDNYPRTKRKTEKVGQNPRKTTGDSINEAFQEIK